MFLGIQLASRGGNSDERIKVAVRALIDFAYYASLHSHTSQTLAGLRKALEDFHANKDAFIELGGRDERTDRCPSRGSAVGSSEQVVLAAEGDWSDCALDGVGVELETAVIEEAAKRVPAGQGVTDCICDAAAGRDLRELGLEPRLHVGDQRQRSGSARALPHGGGLASDRSLDCIELGDALQRFGCDR